MKKIKHRNAKEDRWQVAAIGYLNGSKGRRV